MAAVNLLFQIQNDLLRRHFRSTERVARISAQNQIQLGSSLIKTHAMDTNMDVFHAPLFQLFHAILETASRLLTRIQTANQLLNQSKVCF